MLGWWIKTVQNHHQQKKNSEKNSTEETGTLENAEQLHLNQDEW